MRWWTGAWVVAGVIILAACGDSMGGGTAEGPSGSRSATPSSGAPTHASPSPVPSTSSSGASPSAPATSPSASATGCATGHAELTVTPGSAVDQRLCVRPGTVVSLVLEPRMDDKLWAAVRSSAPVFVLPSGWQVDADGTARASLRCAGTRGGTAEITALAKAPDVAGAARVAFTLDVSVVPYTQER
jgi:hypothetical protein